MSIPVSHSTSLYTLGKGIMYIGDWDGLTPPASEEYVDVGNCPNFEIEVTEERLDHFSSREGTRKKDKSVIIETGYTVNFSLDEVSVKNLQMYLKATLSGTTVLLANTVLEKEYAVKFISDNPAGPNQIWELWRVKLSPNGAFSLIGEDWSTLAFSGEGLADSENHPTSSYFDVTFVTSTTA